MIRIEEHHAQGLLVLYRVLGAVVCLLVVILLAGTVYALVIRGPVAGSRGAAGGAAREQEAGAAAGDIFTGIGRIRALSAGPQAAAVILSVAFPYAPEDRAFSEELAAKIGQFRGITAEYFAALSADELRQKGEGVIKEELRQQYNAILRLGSISRLYFNDYLIIDEPVFE
jgi:flagellar basal body-associated protein FliL